MLQYLYLFNIIPIWYFSEGHNNEFEEWKSRLASESENLRNKVQEKLDELREWRRQEEDKVKQFIGKVSAV